MSTDRNSKAGFSLVEVALALMVVGVGMAAIFSLLPVALDSNNRAIDDVQCALFAEEVFNGYRAQAAITNWPPYPQIPDITIENPVPEMWDSTATLKIQAGDARTNVYMLDKDVAGVAGVVEYALRYSLRARYVPDRTNVIGLVLLVENGQYGKLTGSGLPFYTEIRRP